MLTQEEVLHIAKLARIELGPEEVEKYQKELSLVLDYVSELKDVETEGLEEVSQVTGLENVQRVDVPVLAENRDEILSQAPDVKDGLYKVQSIL